MDGSHDEAQIPFDAGIAGAATETGTGATTPRVGAGAGAAAAATGAGATGANASSAHDSETESKPESESKPKPKRPKPLQVNATDTAPVRVLKGAGYVVFTIVKWIGVALWAIFAYPLALMAFMLPFMLPFLVSDSNGSYDENALELRLGVALVYLVGGLIAAGVILWQAKHRASDKRSKFRSTAPTHGSSRRSGKARVISMTTGSIIAMVLAVVALAYGTICGGSYAIALVGGPKTVAVERPTVTRETKTDDDGIAYQVCAMTFTPKLTFDAGSCEDDGSVSADNRIAQDLLHTHSDHVLLHYYSTITGPIYAGLEDDPRYS
ncbi:hypothetical protein CPA40_09420 [Bifidobacterium callitrichos]|uniref:Uncharacterized protein n=1 Tax=Bifidobacterium callitrichos TaxID=762209 RepID=A0A2T3G8I6_9BIFI|nr:hypothetical protein [Bifidobacterium callitrichos]PST45762.1 hypothetical protein CPA40_09420 [Bifidobacterium callitrichos]